LGKGEFHPASSCNSTKCFKKKKERGSNFGDANPRRGEKAFAWKKKRQSSYTGNVSRGVGGGGGGTMSRGGHVCREKNPFGEETRKKGKQRSRKKN